MTTIGELANKPNKDINSYLLEKFWLARAGLHVYLDLDSSGEIMSLLALWSSQAYMFGDEFIVAAQESKRVPDFKRYPWIAHVYVFSPRYYGLDEHAEPGRAPCCELPPEYMKYSCYNRVYETLWFPMVLQKDTGDYDNRISADELIYTIISDWPDSCARQKSYSLYSREAILDGIFIWFSHGDYPVHEVLAWRYNQVHRELQEYLRGQD